MTPAQLDLLRAFFEQIDRTLETIADEFDRIVTKPMQSTEGKLAARSLRELAGQSRVVRRMVMNPPERSVN